MDVDCVFCKILSGQIPCARVGETGLSLAFLDIMPVAEGHTLVIPKRHVESLQDLKDAERDDMFRLVQRVAGACLVGLEATGTNLLHADGRDAGQVVPHVHVHVVPRCKDDGLRFHPAQGTYAEGRMEEVASLLRATIGGGKG